VLRISRQRALPTRFPDDFHIGKVTGSGDRRAASETKVPRFARNDKLFIQRCKALSEFGIPGAALECAQQYGLPSRVKTPTFGVHFAQPDTEDKKLRKELTLEVPCFEGTLRKFLSE